MLSVAWNFNFKKRFDGLFQILSECFWRKGDEIGSAYKSIIPPHCRLLLRPRRFIIFSSHAPLCKLDLASMKRQTAPVLTSQTGEKQLLAVSPKEATFKNWFQFEVQHCVFLPQCIYFLHRVQNYFCVGNTNTRRPLQRRLPE